MTDETDAVEIGDRVTYNGKKAVVTSSTPSGIDVAVASEGTGGRCRQMHIDVSESALSPGWPE